ncbi:antitoxin Xre/MbcA/ParS toxin-binding domain-containing protein [Burkholderia cenocepacia]|uniref:antitoxin Xre/MbcA/ParS toxin-binding domain-containing protein n=1 Tax=Burkholderia cenocepacia TaxID=95486 RepID=UPI003F518A12
MQTRQVERLVGPRRLAWIVATATSVWSDEDDAREFLSTPHPELERRTPLDPALTELGVNSNLEVTHLGRCAAH